MTANMANYNSNRYTDYRNISLGKVSGEGILRFGTQLTAALSATDDRAIYVRGDALYYWNGSAETDITSGGSGVSTWDSLYDLDKTMTIDDTTLTFALTHATNDGLTLTGDAGSAGDVVQITNAGTGSDIKGTSGTWAFSKAGALTCASIADSTTNATLQVDGNGTGGVDICSTSTGGITLGDDTTLAASKTLTATGTGGSTIVTVTAGDVSVADGSITLVDADNATSVSVTNNTISSATLIDVVSTSLTTGKGIAVTGNGLTNGALFYGESSAAGWGTGFFIQMNDGSNRFTVGADGATSILTGVNSTVGLKVTGIQTSEDMMELTSSGVTASGYGVLLINSSGNSASGSAQIRIAPSGTPVEGSIGVQFVGASKTMQAMSLDGDSVNNSVALINGGGALAANKAVLEVTADGTPAANSAAGIRVDITGVTATNNPYAIRALSNGKDAGGLYIDSDAATLSAVAINGGGAIADNKGVVEITADGTPAATGSNLLRVAFTGTATNKPTLVEITGASKDAIGLDIDTDSVGNVALINGGGNIADNTAVLHVTQDGATQTAGGCTLRVVNSGTPDPGSIGIEGVFTSKDMYYLYMAGAAATNSAAYIASTGNLGAAKAVLELVSTGTPNATGSGLRVDLTGITATNNPYAVRVVANGKDAGGLNIDADAATLDGNVINVGGAIATAKSGVLVTADGTPAAADSNVMKVAFTGTDTNKPVVLNVSGDTKDCMGLSVDADPTTTSMAYFHSAGALAADKATVEVISDAVGNADSAVVRVEQTNIAGVSTCLALKQDDIDIPFITLESTIGVGNAIEAVGAKTLTTTHFVMVDIEGVGTRYFPVGTIA